jgi:hypothetical protein
VKAGDRVETPTRGLGRIVGEHVERVWLYGKLTRWAWLVVELENGERRLCSAAGLVPAFNQGDEAAP